MDEVGNRFGAEAIGWHLPGNAAVVLLPLLEKLTKLSFGLLQQRTLSITADALEDRFEGGIEKNGIGPGALNLFSIGALAPGSPA